MALNAQNIRPIKTSLECSLEMAVFILRFYLGFANPTIQALKKTLQYRQYNLILRMWGSAEASILACGKIDS